MQSKRLVAGLLTLLLVAALLWTGTQVGRPATPSSPTAVTPAFANDEPGLGATAALRAALEAARAGDVAAYLSSFGGALRRRLEDQAQARGDSALADDLKRAALARKGHALYAPEADGPEAYVIMVESVYADRNERQAYRMERTSGTWLITAVETARGRTPRNKYGDLADFKAPQDVPVPTQDEVGLPEDRSYEPRRHP
jgi:hypothetical protein